jgi:hypothetical protein
MVVVSMLILGRDDPSRSFVPIQKRAGNCIISTFHFDPSFISIPLALFDIELVVFHVYLMNGHRTRTLLHKTNEKI